MLIAARNGFMVGGGGMPTARDYPFMPNLAQWDAIENAGWRTHNSNATIWKELISGSQQVLSGTYSWGSDSLNCEDAYIYASLRVSDATSATVEVVADCPNALPSSIDTYSTLIRYGAGTSSSIVQIRQAKSNNLIRCDVNSDTVASISPSGRLSISLTISPDNAIVYVNGQEVANRSATFLPVSGEINILSWLSSFKFWGVANSIRVGSRALTAAEIAANYAIDKARFNLP